MVTASVMKELIDCVQHIKKLRSSQPPILVFPADIVKNFAEFRSKPLRSVTLIKRDFTAGAFLIIFRNV